MTRSRTPKKSPKPTNSRLRSLLGWALKLSLVGLVILGCFAVYLDSIVQEKFSGKRWTIPAKVYARPLELFVGQKLSRDDFLLELDALGYRREAVANGPGAAAVNGNNVDLNTRGFQFYEGADPAQQIHVRFSGDYVAELTAANGAKLAVARLEPLMIGGLYPKNLEDRILIKLDQAPPYLLDTLVTVEDRDFYHHFGVSPKGIVRAFWINASAGQMRQGGSTLTQQLVKNFYLTNERSITRKLTEAMMAVLLEIHYSKQEILEAYLNEVFVGQDGQRAVHGFGLASQYFFSQPLSELKLHQVALLVGLVKGPSYYNPRRNPERALERRNLVLDLLEQQGVATPEVVAAAKKMPLGVSKVGSLADSSFPDFLDLVKRQLRQDYRDEDLTEEGLRIFTSFDPILQMKSEAAVRESFAKISGRKGADEMETAMVVTNPETGEVQALIGSRQAGFAGFNRALDAVRPIGSLVKPAIYLTALERPQQYTLTSWVPDEPFQVKGADGQIWKPQNYDHKAHGNIFLYQGLAHSYNLSSAKLGLDLGIPNVFKTLTKLGVTREWPAFPSMLLGAGALTPIEVATMYQTIASGGFNTPLRGIRSVLTAEGEPLKRYPFQIQQRFDPGSIYLLQNAMQRVMREGTGKSVYNVLPSTLNLAGKSGTTNDSRDSWFAGFSQDLLAIVWMGRDDNGKTPFTGATGALQIWTSFMKKADPLPLDMAMPDNVVQAWVNASTGEGTDASCPNAVQMPYIRGSEPQPGPTCGGAAAPADSVMDWVKGWLN
ncbi:penicillin-binding protein 1B [Pseudomonas sp. CFBP 13711]|uniref:penicillin-binding protein 1B n=1 Tax=unclassified Pseudomonas TaxID=196821 RepID=UPI00177AA580|nr:MULTISPECIES: penicillin-binding protein 1B [unclassified Pseudomonas]MBD8708384.1 penicillin-binding protein 1B [Pseudomonas sp. CFBP 13711]MBD8714950.1 penicillin-binding protein 1B [Pseudomonas sp. CFBP 13715]